MIQKRKYIYFISAAAKIAMEIYIIFFGTVIENLLNQIDRDLL